MQTLQALGGYKQLRSPAPHQEAVLHGQSQSTMQPAVEKRIKFHNWVYLNNILMKTKARQGCNGCDLAFKNILIEQHEVLGQLNLYFVKNMI